MLFEFILFFYGVILNKIKFLDWMFAVSVFVCESTGDSRFLLSLQIGIFLHGNTFL